MIPISYIRSYIGPERFDAAMEAARKERQSGEPITPLNEIPMFSEGENKGVTIEQAREILRLSRTFRFNLPKLRDLLKK